MKKILLIVFIFLVLPCFAAEWVEIFEKQYIDLSTIQTNNQNRVIKFWVKSLRKDPSEKFYDKDYWFTINKWALNCNTKKTRIESVNVYGLKSEYLYGDSDIPEWNEIVPDTYADGYYRMFCLVSFNTNPLLKQR